MTEKSKKIDCKHCAENCPFLEINYLESLKKIPYHCDLFDTFLAFDGKVLRCSECLGHQKSIKEEGLNFINAYQGNVNRSVTKIGFTRLLPAIQQQFVSFLKKSGQAIAIPKSMNLSIEKVQYALLTQLALSIKEKRSEGTVHEELEYLLKKASGDLPDLIDDKICQFLLSLFTMLDGEEQGMLIQILRNPKVLSIFLQKLKFMPNDSTLLDTIRLEIRTLSPYTRPISILLQNQVQIPAQQNEKS